MAKNTYEIQVYTNHIEQGGTDGDVYIELRGEYGTIPFFQIDNAEDNFEQGKTDVFFVEHDTSIGNIKEIGLRLVYLKYNDSWSAGWVKIIHHCEYFKPSQNSYVAGMFEFYFNINHAFNHHATSNTETQFYTADVSYGDEANVPHDGMQPAPVEPTPGTSTTKNAELIITNTGWFEPSFVHPREQFSFQFPIANIGNAPSGNFTIALYLHAGRDTSVAPLATVTTPGALGPGQETVVYWIINGLAEGLYTCTIVLDVDNVVSEVYEGATNTSYIEVDVSDSNLGQSSQPLSIPLVRQVQWVRLTHSIVGEASSKIDMIGGLYHGIPWSVSADTAIQQLNDKNMSYFTADDKGRVAYVFVDKNSHPGHQFLRTVSDKSVQNNLRSLPSPGEFYKDFKPVGHGKSVPI